MKDKKNPSGTKAQFRAMKERERRITTAVLLTIILLMIAFSAYFAYTIVNSSAQDQPSEQGLTKPSLQFKPENPDPELRAAIVDQLSLTFPNQNFTETAASILTSAGYTVDYFSGEKVTVEFYRTLPTRGYKILVLRVHSGADTFQGKQMVGFFTSELYSSTRYVYEQLTDQIGSLGYYPGAQTRYFGISQEFVKSSMNGRFNNTLVAMMGCNGMNNPQMAEAFIERGARVYMGWNEGVSVTHTDEATAILLQQLIIEQKAISPAVENTMKQAGPDPAYNSTLEYYPLESRDYTIQR